MPVRSAKKTSKRSTPYEKPVAKPVAEDMSDDTSMKTTEKEIVRPKVLAPKPKETVDWTRTELSPEFDVNVDPRYRHKDELKALIAQLDIMKKERETYDKDSQGKAKRKEITKQMAEMEKAFRTRTQAEVDAFLHGKSREEILALPYTQEYFDKERFKKSYKATRKGHSLGLSRA